MAKEAVNCYSFCVIKYKAAMKTTNKRHSRLIKENYIQRREPPEIGELKFGFIPRRVCSSMWNGSDSMYRTYSGKHLGSYLKMSTLVVAILLVELATCDTLKTNSQSGSQAASRIANPSPASKELLMAALSNKIEQQHFASLIPSNLLTRGQRPTKLDTNTDRLHYELVSNVRGASKSSNFAKGYADDSAMRHIISMHEASAAKKLKLESTKQSDKSPVGEPNTSSRLSKIGKSVSQQVANNLAYVPKKALAQALTYVSPLVAGSDLLPVATSMANQGLQHFVSRSNKQLFPKSMKSIKDHRTGQTNSSDNSVVRSSGAVLLKTIGKAMVQNLISDSKADPLTGSDSTIIEVTKADEEHADSDEDSPPKGAHSAKGTSSNSWLRSSANQLAKSYIQDSVRGLVALSQLPILTGGQISTAPSVLEKSARRRRTNGNATLVGAENRPTGSFVWRDQQQRMKAIDELFRYMYLISTSARRKRDPLDALASKRGSFLGKHLHGFTGNLLNQRSTGLGQLLGSASGQGASKHPEVATKIRDHLRALIAASSPIRDKAKPRGVIWDMATDPSLGVTVFHLLERASVALPLGFLLMPLVQMIRNPLSGFNLGRLLPAKASHRSIDMEELAKRLDVMDKMLSRALRPSHREQAILVGI